MSSNSRGEILFVDTETTGANPRSARLVQLAYCSTDLNGKVVAAGSRIVRPEGFSIPAEASRIHGITTDRAIRSGIALGECLDELSRVSESVLLVVAHNITYDDGVLRAEYDRRGLCYPLSGASPVCTMRRSTDYCRIPNPGGRKGYKWPKLDELHRHLFGESFERAHDAQADMEACRRCFFELVRRGVIDAPVARNARASEKARPDKAKHTPRESAKLHEVPPDGAGHPSKVVACPRCSQKLRIPSDRQIFVTCPACKAKFVELNDEFQEACAPAARILVCPHCGQKMKVRSLTSALVACPDCDSRVLLNARQFNS